MSHTLFHSVNQHCMNAIVKAANSSRILASDDIVDEKGIKLWSSGLEINQHTQERLLSRKLKRPLETCLIVEDGVNATDLKAAAEQALANEHIAQLVGQRAPALISILCKLPLHNVIRLLLTTSRNSGNGAFDHAVTAALAAGALGASAGRTGSALETLMLSGLLHDIGEAYIDPSYLHTDRVLSPAEWKHIVVHPHVGYLVLSELTDYPAAVSRAVREHHERANGSGYPRKLTLQEMSDEARILSVVTTVCGIAASRRNAVHRMRLGLHLIAGEFPTEVLKLLAPLWKLHKEAELPEGFDPAAAHAKCVDMYARLQKANELCTRLLQEPTLLEQPREGMERAQMLLGRLRIAMSSSGITQAPESVAANDESYLELLTMPSEVGWRARNLAREIAFMLPLVPTGISPALLQLVELLDEASFRHLAGQV